MVLKSSLFGLVAALVLTNATAGMSQNSQSGGPVSDGHRQVGGVQTAHDNVPDTRGSGPYPAVMEISPTLANHVVYRPANMRALDHKKLGVVLWGNGGCSDDGASARLHLAEIASHGYVVIAPGRVLSGPQASGGERTMMATNGADMMAGLDWILAENARKGSRYFDRIDSAAVALSGHSCGGILSLQMSGDPRVKAVIIHNSGIFPNRPERPTLVTDKAWLLRLHTPVLYVVGNATDIGQPVALDDFSRIEHVPVFLGSLDVGHGGTFQQPNGGEAARAAVAWLEWQLRGDTTAAKQFTGSDCGLCTDPRWKVQRKGIN